MKRRVTKSAGWALAFASVMPPPFPFTPFVIAASALQYPRKKLLSVIGAARFVRFSIEGLLAIYFGKRILQMAQAPWLQYMITGLVVLSIGGSVLSVYSWVKRSRKAAR